MQGDSRRKKASIICVRNDSDSIPPTPLDTPIPERRNTLNKEHSFRKYREKQTNVNCAEANSISKQNDGSTSSSSSGGGYVVVNETKCVNSMKCKKNKCHLDRDAIEVSGRYTNSSKGRSLCRRRMNGAASLSISNSTLTNVIFVFVPRV